MTTTELRDRVDQAMSGMTMEEQLTFLKYAADYAQATFYELADGARHMIVALDEGGWRRTDKRPLAVLGQGDGTTEIKA